MLEWMDGFFLHLWLSFLVTELSYRFFFFLFSALFQTFLWTPLGCGKSVHGLLVLPYFFFCFSTYYISLSSVHATSQRDELKKFRDNLLPLVWDDCL